MPRKDRHDCSPRPTNGLKSRIKSVNLDVPTTSDIKQRSKSGWINQSLTLNHVPTLHIWLYLTTSDIRLYNWLYEKKNPSDITHQLHVCVCVWIYLTISDIKSHTKSVYLDIPYNQWYKTTYQVCISGCTLQPVIYNHIPSLYICKCLTTSDIKSHTRSVNLDVAYNQLYITTYQVCISRYNL